MAERLKLGQLLVTKGLIAPEQLASALGEQERWGSRLGMTLVRMGFLEEEALVHVLASQLRLPVARIRGKTVNPEVLERIPVELAEKYRCLPLFLREENGVEHLVLAMEDPSDLEALDELAFQTSEKLRPVLVAPTELEEAMHRHYHGAAVAANPAPLTTGLVAGAADGETAPEMPPLDGPAGLGPVAPSDPGLDASLDAPPDACIDPDLEAAVDELDTAAQALAPPAGAPQPDAMEAAPTPTAPLEAPGEVASEAPAEARGGGAGAAIEPGIILRALSQLLVEKGVITREEFVQRLREIAEEADASDAERPAGSA